MSQRTRYILIIAALAVVIGVGGGLVYYFSRQATTSIALGINEQANGRYTIDRAEYIAAISGGRAPLGQNDIPWLSNCVSNHDGTQPSVYDAPAGTSFQIQYTCDVVDTSVAHTLEVRSFDFRAYVFKVPGEQCRDQDTKNGLVQGTVWPPAISTQAFPTFTDMLIWISHWQWGAPDNNQTCANLNVPPPPPNANFPAFENIQEVGWPDNPGPNDPSKKQTIQIPAEQTSVTITTTHEFDTCDWYQYDDLIVDPATQNYEPGWMAGPRRSFGTIGSANCAAGEKLGNLEVRVWNEKDYKGGEVEYTTPTAGGTDSAISGVPVTIKDASGNEIDYADLCGAAASPPLTGGAGRVSCPQIPVGKYTVTIAKPAQALGNLQKDLNDNPATGEKHNPSPALTLTWTVVEAPAPTGQPTDVVTYFDYGFAPDLGNLEVRMWEEKDQLPVSATTEYSTPTAGGTDVSFPNRPVTIKDSAGQPINFGTCTGNLVTGGAGRVSCFQIPVGRYTVSVTNPDATKYAGPIKDTNKNPAPNELHNANGAETLTLTVVAAPPPKGVGNDTVTYFDFGYTAKQGPVVTGACTIDKSVTDTTPGDEESPDDPKKSNSSKSETLSFTIKYNCPGNPSGGTPEGGITASPIILITDDYDDQNTAIDTSSISTGGNHDATQKLVTWNVTNQGPTGTVSFKAKVNSNLTVGTHTSINKVQITRSNAVDDQDQTVTTIKVLAGPIVAAPNNTRNNTPTPVPPPVNNGGVIPPETGVGAQAIILVLSALAAILVTGLSLRFKFGKQ